MYKYAVLKFGGHALEQWNSLEILIRNINYLKNNNYKIVIVHGGTPSVNEKLEQYNIPAEFINGYRVTTKEVMNVVEEAILGNEVIQIVKTLNKYRINALSLSGVDCNLLKCEKASLDDSIDYGFVGEIVNINTSFLKKLADSDIIPVISPIGSDDNGNSYNLNSDYLASKIAVSLCADYLFMITNVNGVYMNINNPSTRVQLLDRVTTEKLIDANIILPTMATKVNACLDYTEQTSSFAYIIDNTQEINYELFSTFNHGTKVTSLSAEYDIRLANIEDVPSILELMKISFLRYQQHIEYEIAPLKESADDVLKDIANKFVFVLTKDNTIIGTIRLSHKENSLASISRFCIADNYQNLGLGSLLINFVEKYALNKGFNKIGLTTLDNVDYLENFYLKNGYIKLATDTKRGYTRALMVKDLGNNINTINTALFM